ncbi:alpha-protein kinase 3-like isoform X2 [Seriola lalandi dorsalis]|uniref:non-specific serine/threonine protein kinase n=1 Tax=Seriola lalandi dorsalis TaxID=1841481 RepID=A0A3B4W9E9_SERLL|nr:alpha-protein kinase 3-like isoform X2 [Seriola lalandi dorsalis]XP_023278408.1 alpha-protein kinase 3-like isoform X2 [Seriola lalandi dorsalis]XP_023278409.1 alpha-protein kinase 3-like isoform X2 [Seriola lalandi dorsalis]
MTSRRPMTRSFSGNGRTSSFSEEEGSSSNGRNTYLSNVRPENSSRYSHYRPTRSTLCSVMAQLTEDIQPSFETTLKSKAVSENCNVKFTCVVSGYPAPELKWYKDDMEMDRYCGLPKYEIGRNGKTHTLHIYNCTLDDAAIYQASASNSKGIVSCSGVLEVGTMNEYKIHQRFFAKLKQKAEKKKKDLEEQTKKEDKTNIQREKPQKSPERPPRKRPILPPKEKPVFKELEVGEQVGAAAEPNGVSSEVMETETISSTNSSPEKEVPPSGETLAKKKIKISNGVDVGVSNSNSSSSSSGRSHMMGNGGENCYDGGISLAQFLAETLQSQSAEEKQNSSRVEKPKEMNVPVVNDSKETEGMQKEREEQEKATEEEYEREKRSDEDLVIEKERLSEMWHTSDHSKHDSEVKHHSRAHKDHDHHNIQASFSSMLHTVKDFFFGKSKKGFHDHIEDREREFDHDSIQPPQPETPPSFRLQQECNPDVYKPLTEDVVPMETDKPNESSGSVYMQQPSVSLETHEHKHEDSVLHTDLTPADKLPPKSTEESTRQSVKEADDAAEAMEVSVGTGSSSPGEEIPLSGLQVLTETEDKDSQVVSVISKVPVNQQEPDCLVVSPRPDHQAARDASLPREDISVLPLTKTPSEEGEEQLSIDKMGQEGKPDTVEGLSFNKLCEEEKAEVKSSKQPCSDINRSENTELTTPSLEERIEPCESKTPDQVLSPLPAVVADTAEKDYVKEEAKCTSLVQEMNVGFPPSAAPDSLENVDLKIQPECPPSTAEESADVHTLNAIPSSSSGFTSGEEKSDLKDLVNSVLEEGVEVKLCNDLNTQEQATLEGENTETSNECLQFDVETEKRVEESDESKIVSVTQNEGSSANVLEEHNEIAQPDGGETQLGWPSENIPQIQISAIEDTPGIKPTVPDVNQNEHFVIPKIEIMEPELKECTQPLTVVALKEPESEPALLQKHDATHVSEIIVQDQSMTDSPHSLPTEKGMQNDYNLSLAQKVKEVAQLDDETEMLEQEQPRVKSSEQLPQMDYASIPLINVSCTDDKENDAFVNAHVSHTLQPFETPTVPLFVVPPISVTCHESDPGVRLPTHSEWTETETSATTQRGTKHNVDITMTAKPEKAESRKQNLEEVSDKSVKENTPSLVSEAPLPKVGDNVVSINKTAEDNIVPEKKNKTKPLKEAKIENSVSVEDPQKNRCTVERLSCKPPAHPSLSPASLRKFMPKAAPDSDSEAVTAVPVITVGDRQSDKADEDLSGGSTPTSSLSCESSPRLKRRDSLSLIRSATPEELASGARRKIFIPKAKDDGEGAVLGVLDTQGKKETPYMSPGQARRTALLQASTGQNTPPMERRSPLLSRRKATLEVPKVVEETPKEEPVTKREEKPAEKKLDPLKAPQVIRKIRGEPFPDASGHLKLWCQFFNVLSDSTIKWYRDEEEILEVKRSGGDESQVALAIVLASSQDCGVYGCTIKNEYGSDTTDFLLSVDILSEILLRDDLEVGEEIEMTPMLFNKGLADCGNWGEKFFGRIMTETVNIGEGCAHKASKVKVIYGLDPVFDSGSNCIIKVQNPIAYGTKQESNLTERNLEISKQECKVQNMIREYCKIFAAEARVIENFGHSLEVIPQYLMYRPANSVPYATVEADLAGVFLKYCMMDPKGRLITRTISEVEQKCSAFQHWIHQWTHGNLLVTRLEGVEAKLTNVRAVTKSKGYQGLTEYGSPEVFEQFLTQHQCNYYCGLLGLRPLKSMDSLLQPTKIKGSRSPLLNRKLGSNSPQLQRKGQSPQLSRKANSSPRVTRKVQEPENNKSDTKPKPAETVNALEMP